MPPDTKPVNPPEGGGGGGSAVVVEGGCPGVVGDVGVVAGGNPVVVVGDVVVVVGGNPVVVVGDVVVVVGGNPVVVVGDVDVVVGGNPVVVVGDVGVDGPGGAAPAVHDEVIASTSSAGSDRARVTSMITLPLFTLWSRPWRESEADDCRDIRPDRIIADGTVGTIQRMRQLQGQRHLAEQVRPDTDARRHQ